ncbi:hypothetical protein SAMN05421803_11119 [Nocardiopsis flavescens]|uniref:Uncharacterized protein n=1 Tax=Nocardiopsis flavescens TaxID=758803 RepID=A0A1M6N1Q0_9ACTN|nr:hypothetical protein [Nocardiopsis flavescens]SHJ89649.1 hypothetical protein SAMN05421803_11119 [Nocardiopsis flavescens]
MGAAPLFLVFPVLSVLLALAALVTGFAAPYGRRALTVTGGALLLAGSGLALVFVFASGSIYEVASSLNGGRTGFIVLDVFQAVGDFLWATGLLLVALAATRRRPRPRPVQGPPAYRGAPGHPGHPGAHGAPHGGPQRGPWQGGPPPGGPGHPGPRPPHTAG